MGHVRPDSLPTESSRRARSQPPHAIKMRDLVVDTSRHASEKTISLSETYISTPQSSTSTTSASFPLDATSEGESDGVSGIPDAQVKREDASSPQLKSLRGSHSLDRLNHRVQIQKNSRYPGEERKKIHPNGRSKTGCFTCRKRKKKCDEAKPYCNNCTKTNYNCDGYPSRKEWNPSPRSNNWVKAEDGPANDRKLVLPAQPSLPTFPAIESEDDLLFLHHYIHRASRILSMNNAEEGNPWTDIILPMAKDDQALMHSVLALAGSHLVRINGEQRLSDRQLFHMGAALAALRQRLHEAVLGDANSELIMASMIFQLLMSKNDDCHSGTPQAHLKAARAFLQTLDTPFWRFARSFCMYHEFSITLTSLPGSDPRPNFVQNTSDGVGADSIAPATRHRFNVLVGVVDVPLMTLISKLTMLRDQVRQRQMQKLEPSVHCAMLTTAGELGRDIALWHSGQPEGSARAVAAELYRRASLLYLLRTVRAAASPESRTAFATCVQQGLECLQLLPPDDPVQSGLLLPTFILGCGAFETSHRAALGLALDTIESYSGFGNVQPVRDILQRVWATMDAGDIAQSWDWETLTQEMGYAALIT